MLKDRAAQLAVMLTPIEGESAGALLDRLRRFCAARGESLRGVVSLAIARHLAHPPDAPPAPPAPKVTALPPCASAAPAPQKRGPKPGAKKKKRAESLKS